MTSAADLQQQINGLIKQLSLEQLQLLTDCATYLAEAEREAATQEILSIPGLLEQVQKTTEIPEANYKNWRTLRSDV
ncbi:MAG: hypothetical protein ACPGVO_06860 [Spirulinaceae cyanobacterium]